MIVDNVSVFRYRHYPDNVVKALDHARAHDGWLPDDLDDATTSELLPRYLTAQDTRVVAALDLVNDDVSQQQLGTAACACGHLRNGHHSYYVVTDRGTACAECTTCPRFRSSATRGGTP